MKTKVLPLIAISAMLILTNYSAAFASPEGDEVFIDADCDELDPVLVKVEWTTELQTSCPQVDTIIVDVGVEEGVSSIWYSFPDAFNNADPFTITVDDIQWRDEKGDLIPGGIEDVDCSVEDADVGIIEENVSPNKVEIVFQAFENGAGTVHCILIVTHGIVGGELLPIETTSLLVAGAQSFSWMIPVVLSVLGIGLFVVSRKSE